MIAPILGKGFFATFFHDLWQKAKSVKRPLPGTRKNGSSEGDPKKEE